MTNTLQLLRRQWNSEIESSHPDPTLIGELYLAMRREEAISAAYSAAMAQSFDADPTGQDYESLEAFGMTVEECYQQGEDERQAEQANEYALEGVTNY